MHYPKISSLFILLVFSTSLLSCKIYGISLKSYGENEMRLYGINHRDTILDVSSTSPVHDPFIATKYNQLHFYLSSRKGWKFKEKVLHDRFADFSRRHQSSNEASFKIISPVDKHIDLPASSVDKILCKHMLYSFGTLDTVVSEFHRVLKDNGVLIITLLEYEVKSKEMTRFAGKPLPKAMEVIEYFASRNFTLWAQNDYVLNKRLGVEKMLVFKKK